MKASETLIATLREVPQEAVIASHQLMLRSGLLRKLGNGLFAYLPFGLKAFRKVEAIIRSDGYNQPTYYISKGSTTDGETAMRKYGFELWKNGRGDKKRDYIQDDWI